MNAERLNDIYKNIHIAEKSDIDNIRQLTVDYPFYHLPYVVLAKYYHDTSHYKFEDMLRQAAMRVKDRKELYHYIHGRREEESDGVVEDVLYQQELAGAPLTVNENTLDAAAFLQEENQLPELHETKPVEVVEEEAAERESTPEPIQLIQPDEETQVPQELQQPDDTIEQLLITEHVEQEKPSPEQKASLLEFLEDFGQKDEDDKPSEFVFEGKQETIDLQAIEVDRDLIGEEIAAEFSFSKTFEINEAQEEHVPENISAQFEIPETQEIEETPEKADMPEEADEVRAREEPREDAGEPEETFAGHDHHTGQDLRKNPVYTIASLVPEDPSPEDDLSPEKDFFAWLQHPKYTREVKEPAETESEEPVDNKIDLIDRFININPQISRPKKEFFNPENMAKRSEVLDLEYVTETLAEIYKEQGNIDLAIRAYEKLSLQNPSKQAYFASLIENIKK